MKILVKNVQNQKNQLHELALRVKSTLIQFISDSKISSEQSLKLIITLFGPNSNLKFSLKKN